MKKTSRVIINLITLLTIVFIFTLISLFSSSPSPADAGLDIKFATKLVSDFNNYHKIISMDDCTRYSKSINDYPISMDKDDPKINSYNLYYIDRQQKLNIDVDIFENFRSRL